MDVHVVVPTFRETELVESFLESWESSSEIAVKIYVANANPGDETSDLLEAWSKRINVSEVEGSPVLFWTGLVDLGLREVARNASDGDLVVLTNIDVAFEGDPVGQIISHFPDLRDKQVTVPVLGGEGRSLSAGVVVESWPMSSNRHLLDGVLLDEIPKGETLSATYLPTRFLVFPASALVHGIFPAAEKLPHYCADYEYSNRLRLKGYEPIVYTGTYVFISEENTGFDTYLRKTSFWSRLKRVNDIKCAYNFRYRYRFVRLTYPRRFQIPGMLTHFAKIFLEILLGGRQLDRWRKR